MRLADLNVTIYHCNMAILTVGLGVEVEVSAWVPVSL